jgi:hypothetical protein
MEGHCFAQISRLFGEPGAAVVKDAFRLDDATRNLIALRVEKATGIERQGR